MVIAILLFIIVGGAVTIVLTMNPCHVGMHKWGPWVTKEIHHESKPDEKKQWAHLCKAQQRYCARCGKNSPLTKTCSPIVKVLKAGVTADGVRGE